MATLTPNIGLKKPAGSEYPKISDAVNDNADILDANIAKLQEGIAIIVDGDTAAVAVPVGGYAYIKNNQHELPDGLYKNISSSAFPVSGGTADSTVFTAVPAGAVNDAVSALNTKIANLFEQNGFMNTDANQEQNCFGIVNGWLQLSNYPSAMAGHFATMTQIWNYGSTIGNLNENRMQTLVLDDGNVYVRYFSNSTWSNWTSVTDDIEKVQKGIAIIVDGDTASVAVPVGGYAYLKNNTHGLSEGMYKNTSSSVFPASGGTADNTVFSAVPTGAVNDVVNTKLTGHGWRGIVHNLYMAMGVRATDSNGYLHIDISTEIQSKPVFGIAQCLSHANIICSYLFDTSLSTSDIVLACTYASGTPASSMTVRYAFIYCDQQ